MPTPAELNQVLPADLKAVRPVGGGGQREVFEATRAGDKVALKVMRVSERARAEREVAAGSQFNQRNLVRILDAEVTDIQVVGVDYCYFVEEFIDGQSLATLLTSLAECDVADLALNLSAAVGHLWARHRIVHRDIKPANIIRATDGRFVLLDVGIGRHQGEPSLTAVAGAPGTTGYYSPEQINPTRRNILDLRSDLFLIGIVCFQALEGALPFDPAHPDYLPLLASGRFPPFARCHHVFRPLLARLLSPHPHMRYARVAQMRQAIDAIKRSLGCS